MFIVIATIVTIGIIIVGILIYTLSQTTEPTKANTVEPSKADESTKTVTIVEQTQEPIKTIILPTVQTQAQEPIVARVVRAPVVVVDRVEPKSVYTYLRNYNNHSTTVTFKSFKTDNELEAFMYKDKNRSTQYWTLTGEGYIMNKEGKCLMPFLNQSRSINVVQWDPLDLYGQKWRLTSDGYLINGHDMYLEIRANNKLYTNYWSGFNNQKWLFSNGNPPFGNNTYKYDKQPKSDLYRMDNGKKYDKTNWHEWIPISQFPDIPGVYNSNNELVDENVKKVNDILYNFKVWMNYSKISKKNQRDIDKLRNSIVNMATNKSIVINKAWRYQFVEFYKAIVERVKLLGMNAFNSRDQNIIKQWLLDLTFSQLLDGKTNMLNNRKKYYNNVGLQSINGMYELAVVINSEELKKTCRSFVYSQIQNSYYKGEGQYKWMTISDISRGARVLNYTYSSLNWLRALYKRTREDEIEAEKYKDTLNNIIEWYNREVDTGGALYEKYTKVKQERFNVKKIVKLD